MAVFFKTGDGLLRADVLAGISAGRSDRLRGAIRFAIAPICADSNNRIQREVRFFLMVRWYFGLKN